MWNLKEFVSQSVHKCRRDKWWPFWQSSQTQPIFEHGHETDKSNAFMKFDIILADRRWPFWLAFIGKKTTWEIEESNPYMKFWRSRVRNDLIIVSKNEDGWMDRQAKSSANECWWALIGFNTERTNLPGDKPNRSVKIFNVKSVNQDRSRR